MLARLFAVLLALAAVQDTGVLRIRVALLDPTGAATPIPRVLLLVSDNPATSEPRRVRTSTDGTVELNLRPGSYTVESDQPIAFGDRAYSWTQMITVAAGREIVLQLDAKNADVAAVTDAPAVDVESTALLAKYLESVVELWTPLSHASAFVIDAQRGLIATSQRAIGDAIDVEVETLTGGTRSKVRGRVVHQDRLTGAAIVHVDPRTTASLPALAPNCSSGASVAARYQDEITAITAPMLTSRQMVDGEVRRVSSQAIFIEMRLLRDAAGGPVFTNDGQLLGISAIDESDPQRSDAFVVPIASLCETIVAADKKLTAPPPDATPLPLEPTRAPGVIGASTSKKAAPPPITAANFDIRLMTPEQLRDLGYAHPLGDVANWNDYVRDVGPVLLIRVSPQFEESFWKMLARGAAATQGMALPPLKSFTSNFLKMRVLCGDTEVTPIHPFIVERSFSGRSVREGLYVFARESLGSQCASIRLEIFSERSPANPDIKLIDPKLVAGVTSN